MTATAPRAGDAALLQPGAVFGGYRIGRLLGSGGMGAVYQATQLDDGREVALKVLAHEVEGAAFQERFAREGRLAARLSHPNVVYVFRAEAIEGHPAIAMELVPGGTLEERVLREGPLSVDEALRCIQQVIDGLAAAQARGILHRDVKPANCYLGVDGGVKVGDFGLARPQAADDLRLTQVGMFLGTPSYASPEQLLGDPVDVRSDIYAVGATLHFLLSGKPRYAADSVARLIAMVMRGDLDSLEPLGPSVPEGLQAVIRRCLAREADARFQDYDTLREALRAFQPAPQAHAPLSRRLMAGVFDFAMLTLLSVPLGMLVNLALGLPMTAEVKEGAGLLAHFVASLMVLVAYFAIPEGLHGASAGKWLLRVRVAGDAGRSVPSLRAATVRALLFHVPSAAAFGAGIALGMDPEGGRLLLLSVAATLAVLFLPRARRANGWLGEHERFSGTRLERVTGRSQRVALRDAEGPAVAAPWDGADRIGPFTVSGRLSADAPVLAGQDPALDRRVWIVTHPAGTPPLPDGTRHAMRPGHLRWIAGQRTATGGWDAYAAPLGAPLSTRLRDHAPWGALREWLADVAEELAARERSDPGAPPQAAALSPAHVWIGEDGRAVLLPFPLGEAPGPVAATGGLLPALVDTIVAAESARGGALRWPARALRLLEAVRTATPRDAAALLGADAGEPAVLTTQRRLVAWGIPVGFTVAPALIYGLAAWTEFSSIHAEARTLIPLIAHVQNRREAGETPTREDTLVATYIGARLPAVRARVATSTPGTLEHDLLRGSDGLGDSLITLASRASASQRAAATALVEGHWEGRPPNLVELRLTWVVILIVLAGVGAAFSLGSAAVAGRVPLLAMLGLAVVDRSGRPARRLRLLARQLLTWGPAATAAAVIAQGSAAELASRAAVGGIAVASVSVAALLVLLRTPHRGLADRLAGTVVVPD